MSLINDALKKAQRVRHEEPSAIAEPGATGANTRIPKRGRAHSANTTILLGSGAVVLVVLSVVVTVYLVNRTPEPAAKPASPATTTLAAKPGETGAPAPAVVVVAPKLDLASPSATTLSTAVPTTPPSITKPATPGTPITPATLTPAPVVAAPVALAKPEEQVVVFVESLKVAGVRSSGNESRVLMNERVYRVNDIVERTLGLKLIGVAAGTLTFSDPAGATYVKNF